MNSLSRRTLLILFLLIGPFVISAWIEAKTLLVDFTNGWTKDWEPKLLYRRPNRFTIANEDGNKVLKVYSFSSASGIFRKWQIEPLTSGMISWRWKVSTSLNRNVKERTKQGDDFA